MLSDKDLFVQIVEREFLNIYQNLAQNQTLLNIPAVQNAIFNYADKGIGYITTLLFGLDNSVDIDEATEIAKLALNDKIEEFRNKVREQKNS